MSFYFCSMKGSKRQQKILMWEYSRKVLFVAKCHLYMLIDLCAEHNRDVMQL